MKRLNLREVIEEVVSEVSETTIEGVEAAYESAMRSFLTHMRQKRSIVIHNMGRFFLSRDKLLDRLLKMKFRYEDGLWDLQKYKDGLGYIWPWYNAAKHHRAGKGLRYLKKIQEDEVNAQAQEEE